MYCLKCGKDTKDEKIFCDACLETMERYPVKPGTAIQLHKREPLSVAKKAAKSRRTLPQEEQIAHLKKIVFWIGLLLTISVILLGVLTGYMLAEGSLFSIGA